MKRAVVLVMVAGVMSTACSPVFYGDRRLPARPHYRPVEASPVGRWDSVMMLAPGCEVRVLSADGAVTTGRSVAASLAAMRVLVGVSEVELDASQVVRVDVLAGPRAELAERGIRGATTGAGVVGVMGLIAGRMPPARLFGAGAIAGAKHAIDLASAEQVLGTIYLAPDLQGPRPRQEPRADKR